MEEHRENHVGQVGQQPQQQIPQQRQSQQAQQQLLQTLMSPHSAAQQKQTSAFIKQRAQQQQQQQQQLQQQPNMQAAGQPVPHPLLPQHSMQLQDPQQFQSGKPDNVEPSPSQFRNPQEARHLSIQRCILSLLHANRCCDTNCCLPSCQKMKRVIQHTKACEKKTNGECPICKQFITLCCLHAQQCQEQKCPVPFCIFIKVKMWQRQLGSSSC